MITEEICWISLKMKENNSNSKRSILTRRRRETNHEGCLQIQTVEDDPDQSNQGLMRDEGRSTDDPTQKRDLDDLQRELNTLESVQER